MKRLMLCETAMMFMEADMHAVAWWGLGAEQPAAQPDDYSQTKIQLDDYSQRAMTTSA